MLVRLFFISLSALAAAESTLTVPKNFLYLTHKKDNMNSSKNSELHVNQVNKTYRGSYAALGQFPFVAVVHHLTDHGNYFVCDGTIVSKRWVLTAAHCIYNNKPLKFLVAFGTIDKFEVGYDYIGKERVKMISIHGAYHSGYSSGKHDIGLLYMPKDIPFNDFIQPIRLAGASYERESFYGRMGHFYSWGKAQKAGQPNTKLTYGYTPIISNDDCRLRWDVDGTHICTGSSIDNNVCMGDSGGPLVVMQSDGKPLQVGIVSYGDSRCPIAGPTVFTRVTAYHAWIKQVTGTAYA